MFSWPNARDNESIIIEQFKFLQGHLTTESAVKILLVVARHLHYEGAFQSYLTCLRTVLPLVSRSTFLNMFPKSCPGCATLQFLCILYLHPTLENEVNGLFRELLCDPVHRNDTRQMVMRIRQVCRRRENPFPYMDNCLDFDRESQEYRMAQVIGQLFSSKEFCELIKSNSTVGAQIAHQMMKDLQDDQQRSSQLTELLWKYQKLTSEDKLDA